MNKLLKKEIKLLNSKKSLLYFLKQKNKSVLKTLRYIKYESKLKKLQVELIKLQKWVVQNDKKVIIIFEGRDSAGKGGSIRRIIEHLNPRKLKVVALPKPSEKEKSQWYFQRYVNNFPTKGNMVLFDRSWYNRAVVEPVNNFCSLSEYDFYMKNVNNFENMIIDSNTYLVKLYFSISKEEQLKRFNDIKNNPLKKWKFSNVDSKAQQLWDKYTSFKNEMFNKTHTIKSPWNIIKANKKTDARIEAINIILDKIPYNKKIDLKSEKIDF
jgi:polyphosphate kinase 2